MPSYSQELSVRGEQLMGDLPMSQLVVGGAELPSPAGPDPLVRSSDT